MAYSATVTWRKSALANGMWRYNIRVDELEGAAASAWSTKHTATTNPVSELAQDGQTVLGNSLVLPELSFLRLWHVSKIGGTGATYAGRLGTPETPGTFTSAGKDAMIESSAVAAILQAVNAPIAFRPDHAGGRYLSGLSVPNAGSDNSILTHIILDATY